MEKNNFFKNENERNIWIKLNAERINYKSKITGNEEIKMGSINEEYTCMWISRNQCEYDEHECDDLRFSFEELLLLSSEELYYLNKKREEEKVRKIAEQISSEENNIE
jgi:hypothetical protein